MKVYVVENVKPDMQVFADYDKVVAFAKMKADKRRGPATVWLEAADGEITMVYNTSPYTIGESHINIYEREVG